MKPGLMIIVTVLLFITTEVKSQFFQFKGYNQFGLFPFNKDTSDVAVSIDFFDMDRDGDLDAIVSGLDTFDQTPPITFQSIKYFIAYQENIGSRWNPVFSPMKGLPVKKPTTNGYMYPKVADLNDDKIPDFIICCDADEDLNLSMQYWVSQGTFQNYKKVSGEELGLNSFSAGSFYMPQVADMDQDGDNDIFMSGVESTVDAQGELKDVTTTIYAKNTGTKKAPVFEGWYKNTNGLANFLFNSSIFIIGDLDQDNDMDMLNLFTQTEDDTIRYLSMVINDPLVNGKANFVSPASLLGLPSVVGERTMPPAMADLDGDGDLDVLLLENFFTDSIRSVYYENISCTGHIENKVTMTGTTLKANAIGVEYQWFNCNTGEDIAGATQQSFVPTTSGSYAVRLTDILGCENISTCQSVVISATDDTEKDLLLVGPNPAKDFVLINYQGSEPIDRIQLINADGRTVKELNKTGNMVRLELADVTAGQYLLEVTAGAQTTIRKIVVLRQ